MVCNVQSMRIRAGHPSDIDYVADTYAREILRIRPEGTVALLGWSAGWDACGEGRRIRPSPWRAGPTSLGSSMRRRSARGHSMRRRPGRSRLRSRNWSGCTPSGGMSSGIQSILLPASTCQSLSGGPPAMPCRMTRETGIEKSGAGRRQRVFLSIPILMRLMTVSPKATASSKNLERPSAHER